MMRREDDAFNTELMQSFHIFQREPHLRRTIVDTWDDVAMQLTLIRQWKHLPFFMKQEI